MNDIEVGDVVCLKSEPSVKMTVVSLSDGNAQCVYYNHADGAFRHSPEIPITALGKLC